jgi:hypothetical protein
MRGTLQARRARLPTTLSAIRWPSWRLTLPRPFRITGEELEIIERLSRERRSASRSGGHVPEAALHRHWR